MTLLDVKGLTAGYGPVKVLHGLDFTVEEGEVVVMLGANGAGKTTTLRAVSGMIARQGTVTFEGKDISKTSVDGIVRAGIAQVPQGRGTFTDLTVEENLLAGAFTRRDGDVEKDIARWFEVFPRLSERSAQKAGSLSGGEQQMLAIARALMSKPTLLLCDEPSLGLAPIITQGLFRTLGDINADSGTAMLIVEQNANLALGIAKRAYVLETGEVVASGTADELKSDDAVRRAYLGY
jgi:branched-chain amino acid transport system ATP-binding protein